MLGEGKTELLCEAAFKRPHKRRFITSLPRVCSKTRVIIDNKESILEWKRTKNYFSKKKTFLSHCRRYNENN